MMTTLVATLFMVIKPGKNPPDTLRLTVDEHSCFHSALPNTIRFRYSGLARRVLGIRCLHALWLNSRSAVATPGTGYAVQCCCHDCQRFAGNSSLPRVQEGTGAS